MSVAHMAAMKSKDKSTRTGALIIDKQNRPVSWGFNGFPKGVNDDLDENDDRYQRPTKYYYTEHAERNAIYLAKSDLTDCTLYVTWHPCSDCTRAIIQSGITEVVIHKDFDMIDAAPKWDECRMISKNMLDEAGVHVRYWEGPVLQVTGLKNGNEIDLSFGQ